MSAFQDDMFTSDVIADPYTYYGRLRNEDPVHWNEKYELWAVTRHDDLRTYLTRQYHVRSPSIGDATEGWEAAAKAGP
jgi:cytochrome P450